MYLLSFEPTRPRLATGTRQFQGTTGHLRMVVCKHSGGPDHDCIHHFNLEIAKQKLWFLQSTSDAIILHGTVLACSFERVITFNDETLFERRTSNPRGQRATSCEQIDLRIRNESQADEEEQKRYMLPSLTNAVLRSPDNECSDQRMVQR